MAKSSKPLCSESQADQEDILNFQRLMPSLVEHAKSTLHGQFPQLVHNPAVPCTLPIDPRLVGAISGIFCASPAMAQPSVRRASATSRAYAATMELYRLLDVPVDAMASALLDMASTYRAQLQPSAISATQQLLLLGLAGIPLGPLRNPTHLSWSTTG